MKHLISISDLQKNEIEEILDLAARLEEHCPPDLCKGKILATCFFEPSTRTRLSFEAAMLRLGGSVIGFSDAANTSLKKGETLSDSMKVIGCYCDALVIRHPLEGSARLAADAAGKPVINAGDGANQHPTQTLLDLYTIRQCQGKIDGLSIVMAGDLKHGRTVHSLSLALTHFAARLYFVSPDSLHLPDSIVHELRKTGMKFSFHSSIEEVMPKADILYMTRLQRERMGDKTSESLGSMLMGHHLLKAKPNLKVLHPLPRVDEIDRAIDESPHAYYFQQAQNGLYVRMALLVKILQQPRPLAEIVAKMRLETFTH